MKPKRLLASKRQYNPGSRTRLNFGRTPLRFLSRLKLGIKRLFDHREHRGHREVQKMMMDIKRDSIGDEA